MAIVYGPCHVPRFPTDKTTPWNDGCEDIVRTCCPSGKRPCVCRGAYGTTRPLLVGAAMLSVLLFPLSAVILRRWGQTRSPAVGRPGARETEHSLE